MEPIVAKEKVDKQKEEREEALIEFYGSFKDLFEFFCSNTTIHGTVRLVCSSRNKMKTAFWALLLLSSFAMLYWQFGSIFSNYWSYPVIMTISVHSEPKMFPAITICNLNPYRVDAVREKMAELDFLTNDTFFKVYGFEIPKSVLEDDLKSEDWLNDKLSKVNISGFDLSKDFGLLKFGRNHAKVGFQLCNGTGKNCFKKAYLSSVDALQEWYRFHYINIMSQIPPIIVSDDKHCLRGTQDLVYSCRYNQQPCPPRDCTHFHHAIYGSCFTFNSNGTEEDWKASKPGIPYGLSLILKVEQKDHIPLLSTKAGVKVMIHKHNQSPFLEHEAFDVRPGIDSTIGINQAKVTRLDGSYGDCTKDGKNVNVTLFYESNYTLQACLHSCFQQLMIKRCGCGYYYYPLPKTGAKYCNYKNNPGWGHCFYLEYDQFARHEHECLQICRKPCEKGIAKVNIFYEHLDSYSLAEDAGYTADVAMSNMGSQWSLWFGSSVLSVVEMLEFLVDIVILSLIFCYRWMTAKKINVMMESPAISTVSLTLEKYRYVEEGLAASPNMTILYPSDGDASLDKKDISGLFSKYGGCHIPELYTGVVLNGFKYQEDQCTGTGLNG
ncbi:amiloride-sensitive sodium channel subunit delta [Heteronotia binoei]|uniref:amiloride-sensitive sodium channel subunit delta n=1 Tax=Heteronotia binoei TaxID=13085 RepID=UPI00292D7397|nr:amiloride-sensitive sodium channel subunit delta [Heteronotia binoei]